MTLTLFGQPLEEQVFGHLSTITALTFDLQRQQLLLTLDLATCYTQILSQMLDVKQAAAE